MSVISEKHFNYGYSEDQRKFYRKKGLLRPDLFILKYHHTLTEEIILAICIEAINSWVELKKHFNLPKEQLNSILSNLYDEKVLSLDNGEYKIDKFYSEAYRNANWAEVERVYQQQNRRKQPT